MTCHEFSSAWEGLDPGEPLPALMSAHLASCGRCRAHAASDPSRLFALLRGAIPEEAPAWAPFWSSTSSRAAERARRRRVRRIWAAASAAAVVLTGALWLLGGGRIGFAPARPGREMAVRAAGAEVGPGDLPLGLAHAASPLTLESIASPAARVVNFKIFGDKETVTEVILIFDEGIDL